MNKKPLFELELIKDFKPQVTQKMLQQISSELKKLILKHDIKITVMKK